MRGLLCTSLPGSARKLPLLCIMVSFPKSSTLGLLAQEQEMLVPQAGPQHNEISPWASKEPRQSQCTQLHAGRTRAIISSSSGAAAIKTAVYRSRAQFSQGLPAFHFFPLQSQQASAQQKRWLKKRHLTCKFNSEQCERATQPPVSDTG